MSEEMKPGAGGLDRLAEKIEAAKYRIGSARTWAGTQWGLPHLSPHKQQEVLDLMLDSDRLLSQLRDELAQRDAEVERLRRFEAAYIEWQEKTEWVQADAKPKELGKHRADVLRERIDALSVNHRKSGFCGDPYVHDCGCNDCPLSDSYAGHANKVAGEKGNAN